MGRWWRAVFAVLLKMQHKRLHRHECDGCPLDARKTICLLFRPVLEDTCLALNLDYVRLYSDEDGAFGSDDELNFIIQRWIDRTLAGYFSEKMKSVTGYGVPEDRGHICPSA